MIMIIFMMMNLLSGTMIINNVRQRKNKLMKSLCLLHGFHQDCEIGA